MFFSSLTKSDNAENVTPSVWLPLTPPSIVNQCKSGDAGGRIKTTTWPFFELLYFLKHELEPTKTCCSLAVGRTEAEYEDDEDNSFIDQDLTQMNDELNVGDNGLETPATVSRPTSSASSSNETQKRKETKPNVLARNFVGYS